MMVLVLVSVFSFCVMLMLKLAGVCSGLGLVVYMFNW